jgi:hypothetical protein
MKNSFMIFIAGIMFLFVFSCKKQSMPSAGLGTPTLYFAGADGNKAVYWKDGVEYTLPSTLGARVSSISVSGSDVYFAGFEGPGTEVSFPGPAVYWHNGVKYTIPYLNSILPAKATTFGSTDLVSNIMFSGKNIYIGGTKENQAVYWLNGTPYKQPIFDIAYGGSFVNAMTLSGADVYLAGYDYSYKPAYWKNGVETFLPLSDTVKNDPINSFAGGALSCIAVSGNDVYCSGTDGLNVAYWKNGVEHTLPLLNQQTGANVVTTTIALVVSGTDVYIAGHDGNSAVYWKNGTEVSLPSKGNAYAQGLAFLGTDIYIVGTDNLSPVYWKNGTEISLPCTDQQNSIAAAIAFVNQ